jgi:hypothetical protein
MENAFPIYVLGPYQARDITLTNNIFSDLEFLVFLNTSETFMFRHLSVCLFLLPVTASYIHAFFSDVFTGLRDL